MSFSNNIPALQNQLAVSIDLPRDLEGLRDTVNDLYQDIASAVNSKEGALYVPQEKITSGLYFTAGNPQKFNEVYRMVVDFGALPNAGTKNVAHNIIGWNANYRLTRAYGASTDPVGLESLPLPNDTIFLKNNATDVTVTTTANYSTFTESTIVLEYTKAV